MNERILVVDDDKEVVRLMRAYLEQAGYEVLVKVERRADKVEVAVQDNGAGIPAEHLDHVFNRFCRTDSARSREQSGAGLGLAIARAIVGEHGGWMKAASSGPGEGSVFTFAVPIAG